MSVGETSVSDDSVNADDDRRGENDIFSRSGSDCEQERSEAKTSPDRKRKLTYDCEHKHKTDERTYEKRVGKFLLLEVLGKGTRAVVRRGVEEKTHKEYAIKIMKLRDNMKCGKSTYYTNEVAALMALSGHSNVVRLFYSLESRRHIYFIFELCNLDLRTWLRKVGVHRARTKARYIMRSVVRAITACHKLGFVHRDLKLANILWHEGKVKVSDFGLSCFCNDDNGESILLSDRIGTPYYAAPELYCSRNGYCGRAVDVWAIGVIAYILVVGHEPFRGHMDQEADQKANHKALVNEIRTSPVVFEDGVLGGALMHFIEQCLQKDVDERASMGELCTCAWLTKNGSRPIRCGFPTARVPERWFLSLDTDIASVEIKPKTRPNSTQSRVEPVLVQENYANRI